MLQKKMFESIVSTCIFVSVTSQCPSMVLGGMLNQIRFLIIHRCQRSSGAFHRDRVLTSISWSNSKSIITFCLPKFLLQLQLETAVFISCPKLLLMLGRTVKQLLCLTSEVAPFQQWASSLYTLLTYLMWWYMGLNC